MQAETSQKVVVYKAWNITKQGHSCLGTLILAALIGLMKASFKVHFVSLMNT
jgi:hypothetical protein